MSFSWNKGKVKEEMAFWISLFASNLNQVDLNGYYATQEEYACLISGGSCESCVIDDILSCSQAINTMHSED